MIVGCDQRDQADPYRAYRAPRPQGQSRPPLPRENINNHKFRPTERGVRGWRSAAVVCSLASA